MDISAKFGIFGCYGSCEVAVNTSSQGVWPLIYQGHSDWTPGNLFAIFLQMRLIFCSRFLFLQGSVAVVASELRVGLLIGSRGFCGCPALLLRFLEVVNSNRNV